MGNLLAHLDDANIMMAAGGGGASGKWVLIDKKVIEGSQGLDAQAHEKMVNDKGSTMPTVLEAVVLNLMVCDLTGERLCGKEPLTYTRCLEKFTAHPIINEGFGSDGLDVLFNIRNEPQVGVAGVQRNFRGH